jgi:protein-disulfide isomerase
MKNASWLVALLVGIGLGVSADRMIGGAPPGARRPTAAARQAAAPQQARPIEDPKATYRVPLDDTPLRGPEGALVTVVVASDFQCPYCKRVEPTLAELAKAYPDKVRFAWKHNPLPGHAMALPAAIVAEEARAQGGDAKFWSMHDRLFQLSPSLDRASLEGAAQAEGLDVEKVKSALDRSRHVERIQKDQQLLQGLGASSTPTMFVNGRKVVGALPLEQFKMVVDEELKKAEAVAASGVPAKDVYAKLQERAATSTVYLAGLGPSAQQPSQGAQPGGPPPAPYTTSAKVPLRADDPIRGAADAKVTIAVFSDFQCPFCSRVLPTLAQAERSYPGAVRVTWKHMPLGFHPNARPAAEAAEAAREQGKFWEMHDKLFGSQARLSPSLYEDAAKELGLDVERFKKSLEAHSGAKRIDEDMALAAQVGVSGTPGLYVNCRFIPGAYPFESIKPILEEELKKADALAATGTKGAALYDALCAENLKAFRPTPAVGAAAAAPGAAAKVDVKLRKDDPAKGQASAPVTLVVFSDFQCPFCARAEPSVAEVEKAYPHDVRVVWKNFPLTSIHPYAMPAALASEAAREQGKFWEMHDKLFANQPALAQTPYETYAKELGLDLAKFKAAMASDKAKARVQEDAAQAQQLGVNGTPTFIVNGETVVGGGPALRVAVERQLAQARVAKK